MVKLNEEHVEKYVRKHLEDDGWEVEGELKKKGEHGPDIKATKKRKGYKSYQHLIIETKGEVKNVANRYYGLFTLFGQIVSRMKKLEPKKYRASPYYRIYGIALPEKQYSSVLRKRAKEMEDAWRWLRLKIFLVKRNGKVVEKSWEDFLK
jgi:hypothetical protein